MVYSNKDLKKEENRMRKNVLSQQISILSVVSLSSLISLQGSISAVQNSVFDFSDIDH